ncbi:MAG: DNA mismatch repair protein MutS [Flavobacteriales bacterium]|nr:DNA mismatch repair protein MutS [Flavobacteriales bacterium]MBL6873190.1 DNA mismatch repair protein MutS [Flavobacteriales bacterium]
MKQYNSIKAKYPTAMLLFRVGDFYETFGDDAVKASKILGITLTKRSNGSSNDALAGFPHHALDTYLPKLVRSGQRVAICDQLEDPKATKSIVKRGVTELVTPGVSYNDKVLDHKSNNFLASIHFGAKEMGISFLDISTGEFLLAQGKDEYVGKLIQSFNPSEIVIQKQFSQKFSQLFGDKYYTSTLEDWVFTDDFTKEKLLAHFGTLSLKGFGVESMTAGTIAAGAALHYLSETHHNHIKHIVNLQRIEESNHVWMDRFTIRNLELFNSSSEDAITLIDIIDFTITPMASRLLKRWMAFPLKEKTLIEDRLSAVDYFMTAETDVLSSNIKEIGDLERLISKVATARINPREVVQLKKALNAIEPIKAYCKKSNNKSLVQLSDHLNLCEIIRDRVAKEINDDAPIAVSKGKVISKGVNSELDDLRSIAEHSHTHLQQILERETERTAIPSLKIAFNNVFGYYLEVRNTHKDKVPEEWIRKQTLVNAERYVTQELKELETKILGAEEKILALETSLFNNLVLSLIDYIPEVQINAQRISQLDCLLSFAELSKRHRYTKPEINDGYELSIKNGRHPVIEQQLAVGEEYIANDVYLNRDDQQIIMITGPNMSGKSAILRQTALIVLLAQMGCFIPAESASIGIVDKVFTRVGASDNISQGESTFMVEMNETASILNNISDRSLILLDEIGRGTSTYDGISIAWAIAEFVHEHSTKAKTLFATHYHELNDMTSTFKRIKNFNVSVKEIDNQILFLRKLVEGGSEHSFGIHVAKMAGMPKQVVDRSKLIMKRLEKAHSSEGKSRVIESRNDNDLQLSFFQLDDPILERIRDEIKDLDINSLTPVEALMKLNEIKKVIGQ